MPKEKPVLFDTQTLQYKKSTSSFFKNLEIHLSLKVAQNHKLGKLTAIECS